MSKARRVVVTGIGVYSPIGNSMETISESLTHDKSGIVRMTEWDAIDSMHTRLAGVCHIEGQEDRIDRSYRRTMGRVAILSALAVEDAIKSGGLTLEQVSSGDCGLSFGSTTGSSLSQEEFLGRILATRSLRGQQASTYPQFMSHTCAANVAAAFGIRGPVVASCTACVSGSQGIGFAYEQILLGRAKCMLGGGAEEMHFMDGGIFDIMRAASTKYNDEPERSPRPFDVARDGLVVAEGAGCLLLEEYEHARKRSAPIIAELIGFGTNCDGSHITRPEAEGMAGAMRRALKDAELDASAIEYVNCHATATIAGDIAESEATNAVYGPDTPVSGIKGYTGHTLGACGAIEAIATLAMMERGFLAPTKNLENVDPATAPLNHIIGSAIDRKCVIAASNNFAFGGVNTSLIFSRI